MPLQERVNFERDNIHFLERSPAGKTPLQESRRQRTNPGPGIE
jgi:hypothetical protein